MNKVKGMMAAMSEFNSQIQDCVECPFFDDICKGDKSCLMEDLIYLLEICLREGVTME